MRLASFSAIGAGIPAPPPIGAGIILRRDRQVLAAGIDDFNAAAVWIDTAAAWTSTPPPPRTTTSISGRLKCRDRRVLAAGIDDFTTTAAWTSTPPPPGMTTSIGAPYSAGIDEHIHPCSFSLPILPIPDSICRLRGTGWENWHLRVFLNRHLFIRSSHGLVFLVSANSEVLSTVLPSQFLGLVNGTSNGTRSARTFTVEFDTIRNAGVHATSIAITSVSTVASIKAARRGTTRIEAVGFGYVGVGGNYDGDSTELVVTMAPLGVSRPRRPLLQTTVNLSDAVQGTAYVGFMSSTGILFTRHIVVGWRASRRMGQP
uniref:Legume lectin domain-containing protein n=1 Tax=Oryza punctata TaxID=4537 RepID=A0A0E0LMJ4_ORYPU